MIPKEDAQKITQWAQELDDDIFIDLILTQDEPDRSRSKKWSI
jgi:hypothetical protein